MSEKYNKLEEELNSLKKKDIKNNENTISKNIEINIKRDNNKKKETKEKIKIIFPEPVIIKKQEKRRPSKFKKALTFDENKLINERENIIEKNKDNKDKNIKSNLPLKIKTDNFFEKNDIKEEENNNKENEEKDINITQEEKMSKALLRLKNGKEGNESEQQNNEIINNYDKNFKKALYQNLVNLLEDDSKQRSNNDNMKENNNN